MAGHALGKLIDYLSLRDHPQTWCGCVACVLVQALPVHLVWAWDRTYRRSVCGNHPWAGHENFLSTLLRSRKRQPEQ